jgi:hypothetical protein
MADHTYYDDEAEEWFTDAAGISLDCFDMKYIDDGANGDPTARLKTIELFLRQDYGGNPVAEAIQNILRPVIDINFDDHVGTDNRKGAVARAMGLSKGWPGKNAKRDHDILISNLFKPDDKPITMLDDELAKKHETKSPDVIRKVRCKNKKKGHKVGRRKN